MGCAARFLTLVTSPNPFFLLRLSRNSRLLSPILQLTNRTYSTTRSPVSFAPIRAAQSKSFHSQSNAFKDDSFPDQIDRFSGGCGSSSGGGGVSDPNWHHPWPEWSRFIDSVRQGGYFQRVDHTNTTVDVWGFASVENFPSPEFLTASKACLEFARDRDCLLGYLSMSDIRTVVDTGSAFLFRDDDKLRIRLKSFLGIDQPGAVLQLHKATLVDLVKILITHANVSLTDWNHANDRLVGSSVRNLLSELANLNFGVRELQPHASVQNHGYGQAQAPRGRGPQIEMKRGDWICPKCTFMNFARNIKCLECEEPRPRRQLTNGEWECPQCDFFNYGRNIVCLRCDCKRPGEVASDFSVSETNKVGDEEFPEMMPMRKGVNRFVVSTRKTPLEGRLANAQAQRELGNENVSGGINKSNNYGHVPFVPLPPDMFSAKPEVDINTKGPNHGSHTLQGSTSSGFSFTSSESDSSSEKLQLSERPVSVTAEGRDNSEQAEKSERWFKRVAELHDVTDLASAISDEDFPELMPLRKGETRFVVNKKKDRTLTTPLNNRRPGMEQASESKFVPFVPFPPDYFAKKDQPHSDGLKSSQTSTNINCNSYDNSANSIDKSTYVGTADANNRSSNFEKSAQSGGMTSNLNSEFAWNSMKTSSDATQDLNSSRSANTRMDSITTNSGGDSQKVNAPVKDGWSGKSLEGSAVKEIDPLDMSEEAKAERWFRRAAQIKDISELSQIPDEDFPSIMPMRKGVNRFVVSKRKTPLERRLTSPQYRRNLPIVDPDSSKTDNEK